MTINKLIASVFVLGTTLCLTGIDAHAGECSGSSDGTAHKSSSSIAQTGDIVDTAARAGQFQTLLAALEASGLHATLRQQGPYTVLAPNDAAFARLPAGTVEALLLPKNRDQLAAVLSYHVIPGRLEAAHLGQKSGVLSANGQRIDVRVRTRRNRSDVIKVDGARVVRADIEADNGIIHVVDRVLMPAGLDVLATARKAGTFMTLLAALDAAELDQVLHAAGPYTVFAPTDKAFARLGKDAIRSLLRPENRAQLVAVLKNHVVAGRLYTDQALATDAIHTLAGADLRFAIDGKGGLRVNGTRITATNLDADNGVIHIVDRVLVPRI